MTDKTGLRLIRLILVALLVQLVVIGYVFWSSYQGRDDLVQSERAGCERVKSDRVTNLRGWRVAEAVRRTEGDILIAEQYKQLADDLQERSDVICSEVYPEASLIP